MALDPLRFLKAGPDMVTAAPLAGTRPQRAQRVQVGLAGMLAIVMLVALADAVGSRAQDAQDAAVPEAAPTTEPSATPTARDPLAEAGVVPEVINEPEAQPGSGPQQSVIGDVAPPAPKN